MPLILPGNVGSATAATGFNVANSCRFDGSSASMKITPGSNMNLLLQTWSGWIKRGGLGVLQSIFASDNTAGSHAELGFDTNDKLNFRNKSGNADKGTKITTRVFKDPSAWYHIVWAWDSANGTAANRLKIYVNGVQETAFDTSTNPDGDEASQLGEADVATLIGTFVGEDSRFFNGYLAEVVLIDGAALAPTSFGEFDSDSGIWKPIDVSGLTFGTHGFYLDFEASGNLGNDANGGTDLGETNLAATDQSTDTCTNNFATMLPLTKSTDATLSEGNLNVTYGTASTRRAIFGSIVVTAGKWFCETKIIATSQTSVEMNLGISNTYNPEAIGNALISANGFTVSLFPSNGSLYIGSTRDEQGLGNLAVNDIIGMAINIDDGTLQFYKNGSALGSANDITTGDSDDGELYPGFTIANSCSSGGQTFTASHNFGSPAYSESGGNSDASGFGNFSMSVPSGFFSICTKNLAEYG